MKIKKNVDLSKYSTFRIGGKASFFVEVSSVKELKESLLFAKQNKISAFILGGGSNILLPDKLFRALVVRINIKGINFDKNKVWVGAGENWDSFVKKALDKKLYGLENLSSIPGNVGATPIQNVGAYDVDVSKFIKKVETLDRRNLKVRIFSAKECQFGYRDSFFKTKKGRNYIITRVQFSLDKKYRPNIKYKDLKNYFGKRAKPGAKEVRNAVIKIRKGKFPNLKKFGTAGSFFKNPIITKRKFIELNQKYSNLVGFKTKDGLIKVSLAYILDKICNLADFRIKNVGLYKKQPLVFVNYKKAKQRDILKLKKEIEKRVFQKIGIKIKPEVTIIKN